MKNRFAGFTSVFKFAYAQSVKTKAFVITMVVLCVVALAALPVITAFSQGDDSEKDETKAHIIGDVYIEDNVFEGKLADKLVEKLKLSEDYKDKELIIAAAENHEETYNTVTASESGDVLVQIDYNSDATAMDYGFNYVVYYGENTDELDEASDSLAFYIDELHETILAELFLKDQSGAELVTYSYTMEVMQVDKEGEIVPEEGFLEMSEYWVTYAFIMVGIFAISIVGSKVSEQIVTEKSSKVIEYIMTSIKPMALITGKVMASIAVVLTMIVAVFAAFLCSIPLNGVLFPTEDGSMVVPEVLQYLIDGEVMAGANVFNIIIALIIMILGFVFYGFIAGIAGATVSKVEEMAEGVKMFTFAMIIGAYLCLAYVVSASMGAGDWGVFSNVIYLFPLTSVFILPAYLLLGKVSVAIALIGIAIMIICILLLMIFVSGIYEYLIYYNGSPLKFKDLIGIFRNKRRAE